MWGQDREDALAVIHDDQKFDRWMKEYEKKKKQEAANLERERNKGSGGNHKVPVPGMDKEAYLEQMGNIVGG